MNYKTNKRERGASLLEFAIAASVFLTVIFGVLECGRLLWTHNALKDAVRQGARYATVRRKDTAGQQAIRNMVVYGNAAGTGNPVASGLTTGNVAINYNNSDPNSGIQMGDRATVSITGYQFRFAVPLVGGTLNMPSYSTAMPGESFGFVPCDNPAANQTLVACTNIAPL